MTIEVQDGFKFQELFLYPLLIYAMTAKSANLKFTNENFKYK